MSYPMPLLCAAVRNRLLSDTGSGGLYGTPNLVTAVVNTYLAPGSEFPYIAFHAESTEPRDSFREKTDLIRLVVSVYCDEQPSDGTDQYAAGTAILARVQGDWEDQSSRSPTYGLDRWRPSLTGWSSTVFEGRGTREAHEVGVFRWISEFEIYVSRSV